MTSIRSRLLLFLLPLTIATLAVTALGIDGAVRRDLRKARDLQVLLLAQAIGSVVDVEIDNTVEFEIDDGDMAELGETVREGFYAVAAEDGTVLFSSGPAPEGLFVAAGMEPAFLDTLIGGEEMRTVLISIIRNPRVDEEDVAGWIEEHPGQKFSPPEPRRFFIAAGQPDRGLAETALLVRRRLVFGFGLLCALLVVIPVMGTGFSLQPLGRLSRQADRVDADNPYERLDEKSVDQEVRALVSALNRALDRLGIAYNRQKRFTADAAHELRSPLSAIRAQCEVGLRKSRDGKELEEVLQSVHRTTLRMSAVVENLLSLSRLHEDGAVIEKKPVDLSKTAGEAISLLAPLAESRGTSLRTEIAGPANVSGDDSLILECVSILLDNAIRYTPKGGLITVRTGDNDHPWCSVSDTGIGISEEHLEKIFERFYRVDSSRAGGGSGLGLSIAAAIARLHDAEITVASTPGEGSLFTLLFGPSQQAH